MIANESVQRGVDALSSVEASRFGPLELAILTHGMDHGIDPVLGCFLDEHPALPALLLSQSGDPGVARSRNTLVSRARGEYVFVLDIEGGIYPSALNRLAQALDSDPQATFSYPMVAAYDGDRAVELLSSLPWEPERLSREDWIDGMALIRRRHLLDLGGYAADPCFAGAEDFFFWCRCAEAGRHGVHVPQVLAWRPRSKSPITIERRELMRELFPRTLAVSDRG